MLAFQFLQKSLGAPANDEPAPPVEEQRKALAEKLVEAIYRQERDHRALSQVKFPDAPVKEQLTFMDLLSGIQRSHAHASRQQRLLVPDDTPSPNMPFVAKRPNGLSPLTVLQKREDRIRRRAQQRQHELENKLINGTELGRLIDENYQETVRSATPSQMNDIIKLKSLRLRDKQIKVREEVLHGQEEVAKLSATVDRAAYRKLMKQSMREAKMTEKLEKQQRLDKEKREKQRHLDYLQSVCNQGRDLIAWHKTYQAKMGKLGKAVLQFHAHIEREEQRRADRLSKERIRALRNDDEEAYMKLIDEAKDTRLTLLLKQTGTYLESLTRAVVDQQNDPVHRIDKADDLLDGEQPDEETMLTDSAGNKIDYFRMAHRIQESVSQPSILSGGKLKEYQVKGLQWMVSLYNNKLNGILADEMGLGKTIQTISLVTYLIEKKNQNGPFLIIVPLSTITNWELEFEKWAPSVTKIVYKGPPDVRKGIQRSQIKHRDFQVLLTTFDYIIKDRPALSKIKWTYMIIDEGHRMKNTQSKLTSVLRQYYDARYRLILTGTPLQNNLPELWALLNFILPRIFNSVKSFEEWFNTPFSNQGVQDKVELNEEEQLLIIKRLHKVLRPFLLRRLKKDVESELPDKVERVIKCKLSALQSRLYWQMKKHGMLFAGDSGGSGRTSIKGLNNTIMQLRKICNHPFVFEEVERVVNPYKMSNDLLYRTSGKFELLDRILPKLRLTGHRVLIFFQMTQIMDIMEDFCIYRGYRHLRLDGSTKSDDRSRLLQVFNAPDSPYFVFLLSTRAGGLGLNLQTADTVIIFDSDWNPHQDLQAQDRAHRIGQTKEVRIFRLITENSIEENILARAQYKLDIDGKVIQAGKFDHRSTEEDREAFLRSLLEDKSDERDDNEENEDLDDEELNLMLKRSDQEYATFTKIDLERQRATAEEWRQRYGDNHPPGAKPERLMQDWELPDIYRYDNSGAYQAEDDVELLGRGLRTREQVQYDDGMTEGQWLRRLEKEASSSPGKRGLSPDTADRKAKKLRI
ncbi:SNF2 family N-terminal domain-containing protein [Fennellomyces sp. T-0311]|nr:SNF2 family N-terminal domain-containing protein [Fennellomyces sp. T-0311]